MKKYELIYDLDRKIISTYNGKSNEKEPEKNKNSNLVLIIILIALGVVVIGLIAFIIYYIKKPKRNRAFELNDDNYEYFPNEWYIIILFNYILNKGHNFIVNYLKNNLYI